MKLNKIVFAYKILGEAKVQTLAEKEVIKVIKARKTMRPHADEYEAFLKDVQEKFKPEDWDDLQKKVQQWREEGEKTTLTKEEQMEINKKMVDYQKKVEAVVKEELEKEIKLEIEPLSEESHVKLLIENGCELGKLEEIEAVL